MEMIALSQILQYHSDWTRLHIHQKTFLLQWITWKSQKQKKPTYVNWSNSVQLHVYISQSLCSLWSTGGVMSWKKLVYSQNPATADHELFMLCSAFLLEAFQCCEISFKSKLGKTAVCPQSLQKVKREICTICISNLQSNTFFFIVFMFHNHLFKSLGNFIWQFNF